MPSPDCKINHAMKTKLFPLLLLVATIFIACTPKLNPTFKEQQSLHFSSEWQKLEGYPLRYGRTDDLHFFNPEKGFTINSQGHVVKTNDGGVNWEKVFRRKGTFFRCLTFKDSLNGWVGTLGPGDKYLRSADSITLYETHDGGASWEPTFFDGPYPKGLCGLQTVSDNMIVGCGRVRGPSYFIKSEDGGETWKSYDYNHLAGSLIAPYFYDEKHGLLIGGTTQDKIECRSLVLETFDGGATWDTLYVSKQKGEYCWKVSFPTEKRGFISVQRNVKDGRFYVLQTEDGGKTWFENEYREDYYYVQGVGFINENVGWLGGTARRTMETRDGGKTWKEMADAGSGFNKFQFFGDTIGYGVGFGVFKIDNVKSHRNGVVTKYHENGERASELNYKNGRLDGPALYFYENGQLKSKGDYSKNLRVGKWQFIDRNTKQHSIKFKNGRAKVKNKTLESYAGKYEIEPGVYREITFEKGQLFSKRSDSTKSYELYPIGLFEFVFEGLWETRLVFNLDGNGTVKSHSYSNRGRDWETAPKVSK